MMLDSKHLNYGYSLIYLVIHFCPFHNMNSQDKPCYHNVIEINLLHIDIKSIPLGLRSGVQVRL